MLRVGITGGIGSGKSVVCRVFRQLGIPVYDADSAARRLMEESTDLRTQIILEFGDAVYPGGKSLDRKFLASVVFPDPNRLAVLNGLVHPFVIQDYSRWCSEQKNAPFVLREAAIMLESGTWKDLDAIILVDAPEDTRISRVLKRDGRTIEEIRSIISRQWTSEEKRKYCRFIIENDDHRLVLPQVNEIYMRLKEESERSTN